MARRLSRLFAQSLFLGSSHAMQVRVWQAAFGTPKERQKFSEAPPPAPLSKWGARWETTKDVLKFAAVLYVLFLAVLFALKVT